MFTLNIDDILADASVGGYQGNIFISNTTALALLSALVVLNDFSYWTNDVGQLDDSDLDIILELIALANYELQTYIQVGDMDIGTTFIWWSSTPPAGSLKCDGTQYLKADYPVLSALLGSEFSVDATNFVVPDLRGRVAIGQDTDDINDSGGSSTVTLTEGQLPAHAHDRNNAGIREYAVFETQTVPTTFYETFSGVGAPSYFVTETAETGSDQPHDNMPPYRVATYMIKAL